MAPMRLKLRRWRLLIIFRRLTFIPDKNGFRLNIMSVNLLDFDAKALAGFCAEIGEKPFRAKQLLRWIHRSGEADFAGMSDLAKGLRDKLAATAVIEPPRLMRDHIAAAGT